MGRYIPVYHTGTFLFLNFIPALIIYTYIWIFSYPCVLHTKPITPTFFLLILVLFRDWHKLWSLLLWNFLVYYSFICPISRYSPHNPVPKHSQRLLFPSCERPSFAPIIFIYCCDGVRLCLWNWTANRTTVCPPDDTWMSRSIGGIIRTGKYGRTQRKTCSSATWSTKNFTSWTRASVARSRRLTTWAMSRSVFIQIQNRIQECLKCDETWNTCQNPCVWKLH
jgi:hypothetical protein